MKSLPLIIVGLSAILIIGSVVFFSSQNKSANTTPQPQANTSTASTSANLTGAYELFWGDGCPHCANVEKFLQTWELKDKIKIDQKEVYKNAGNANLLLQKAAVCNISQDQIAVPFMVTPEGKCFLGDTPIIDLLKGLKI